MAAGALVYRARAASLCMGRVTVYRFMYVTCALVQVHPGNTVTCVLDCDAGTLAYGVNDAPPQVVHSGLSGLTLHPAIVFYGVGRCASFVGDITSSRQVAVAGPTAAAIGSAPAPSAPAGPWVCATCTLENRLHATVCDVCGSARTAVPAPAGAVGATSSWACTMCTFENSPGATACEVCLCLCEWWLPSWGTDCAHAAYRCVPRLVPRQLPPPRPRLQSRVAVAGAPRVAAQLSLPRLRPACACSCLSRLCAARRTRILLPRVLSAP